MIQICVESFVLLLLKKVNLHRNTWKLMNICLLKHGFRVAVTLN